MSPPRTETSGLLGWVAVGFGVFGSLFFVWVHALGLTSRLVGGTAGDRGFVLPLAGMALAWALVSVVAAIGARRQNPGTTLTKAATAAAALPWVTAGLLFLLAWISRA